MKVNNKNKNAYQELDVAYNLVILRVNMKQ